jgi:hypothetical protein
MQILDFALFFLNQNWQCGELYNAALSNKTVKNSDGSSVVVRTRLTVNRYSGEGVQ